MLNPTVSLIVAAFVFAAFFVAGVLSICEIVATLRLSAELKRFNKQKAKTLDYQRLYEALLSDVTNLAADFRSMALGASDREAPAYEDAQDMTDDVLERTYKRNNNAAT